MRYILFENIRLSSFLQILLFLLVLSTPRLKKLLLGGSCSKNPEILKCKSFDVYFSICRSQNRAIIQPKFIDCLSDIFFFKFRSSSLLSTYLKIFVAIIRKVLFVLCFARQPANTGGKKSSTQKSSFNIK